MTSRTSINRNRCRFGLVAMLAAAMGAALPAPAAPQDAPVPDMRAYLAQTRVLVGEGRHAEALERMIWFHEHALEYEQSMTGVRLSFALANWADLGKVYPPALTALVEMRDSTQARFLRNPSERGLFLDLRGLNRALGDEAATFAAFDRAATEQPASVASLWRIVLSMALEAKRFDLFQKHDADLLGQFERQKASFEADAREDIQRPDREESMRPIREDRLVAESLKLITVALAIGQRELATTIQTLALELVVDQQLLTAVP